MGRVLRRVDADGKVHVRCSCCTLSAEGPAKSICCCGATFARGRHAKLRCVKQDTPTPEFPCEIVAGEVT